MTSQSLHLNLEYAAENGALLYKPANPRGVSGELHPELLHMLQSKGLAQ